jgi:hypothetical protein
MSMVIQAIVGLGIRIVESSPSEERHSVEILWKNGRPDKETSTYLTHKNNKRQMIWLSVRFEPANPESELS